MRTVYAYNDDSRNGCARDVCRDGKYCKYKFCKDAHPNLRGKVDDIKYSTYCKYGSMESCVRRICYFSHSFYSREEFNSLKRSRQETHEKEKEKEKNEEINSLKRLRQEKNEEPEPKPKEKEKEKNEEVIRMNNIYAGLCDEYCKYIQNISCSSATEPGEIAPIDLDKLRDNYCILRESYNNLVKSFSSI